MPERDYFNWWYARYANSEGFMRNLEPYQSAAVKRLAWRAWQMSKKSPRRKAESRKGRRDSQTVGSGQSD